MCDTKLPFAVFTCIENSISFSEDGQDENPAVIFALGFGTYVFNHA
jgi:hypothetical protein